MIAVPLILLVEDREDDIFLVREAFERAKVLAAIQIVRDGDEAISYLSGTGRYSNRAEFPLPSLVLLDLKMPRVDGFEVLTWIRSQSGFGSLVVLVLTVSEDPGDVSYAYELGANSFMVKSLEFRDATACATMIDQYWLQRNSFPETFRRPRGQSGDRTNIRW